MSSRRSRDPRTEQVELQFATLDGPFTPHQIGDLPLGRRAQPLHLLGPVGA